MTSKAAKEKRGGRMRLIPTKAELLAERDAASKSLLDLVAICERLIAKLRDTRYMVADIEASTAEREIIKIRTRGVRKQVPRGA